ncbi:HAMP domain-containing sensor histidine kinase [Bosea sp. (in: a-proteobacteria)]|uniref:sensor histidine kinase n=1 Tax=Bosea sp. (in: a-proteobacteria) TaxID=1871050 RepID=UPI0025BD5997|nr:HAMP domain-containing sensor histidine kinase [Bosea sp. (in: a-proteobacteria)]
MRPHSLISVLTRRLVLGSVLLTMVNIALVMGYYSLDRDELQREKISRQISRLEAALSRLPDGTLRFTPGDRLIHDFRDYPEAYAYRILDHDGRVVDAANAGLVPPEVWAAVAASDAGSSTVQHEGRTVLVGSQKVVVGGKPARIGFASVGDPSRLVLFVFFDELFVHVFVALLPFAACLVLVNIVTVRQSMRPLIEAARAARETGHGTTTRRLPTAGLPAEILDMVEAINDALGRLEDALEAERAFTAEAAHALRTPLAVLSARVAQLPNLPGAQPLRDDVARLTRLVEQMLSAAQADTLVVDPAMQSDLAAIARSVVADMAPIAIAAGRHIAYEGPDACPVMGDADAIAHALRNLADNGLRFTPAGTEVTLIVEETGRLSVRDHGPGIPASHRDTVFKRFWRGAASDLGGTGLGLAIVKRIAEAHQAEVGISDATGGGALVSLRFHRPPSALPPDRGPLPGLRREAAGQPT